MVVTELPKVTDVSLEHKPNAFIPMVLTVLGMVIEVRFLQL